VCDRGSRSFFGSRSRKRRRAALESLPELDPVDIDPLDIGPPDEKGVTVSPAHQCRDRPGRPHTGTLEAERGGSRMRTHDDAVELGRLTNRGSVEAEPYVTDESEEARAKHPPPPRTGENPPPPRLLLWACSLCSPLGVCRPPGIRPMT